MSESQDTFLGMPGYEGRAAAAGRPLWRARRDMSRVLVGSQGSSLLAMNFNVLWANAMNARLRGYDIRYFAMLHDDVAVEDWWLDGLIEDLEKHDLDVLSAVIPIKSPHGLTSTALDDPGSPWNPKCRLTMHEVYRLPEVFTSEDVGNRLLVNTGCWVCRFDQAWPSLIRFTINDRIIFDEEANEYRVEVEPEDWNFSRQCHSLGLRIGATRKPHLMHNGTMQFRNTFPWGTEQFDSKLATESLIPQRNGIRFPHDVDGWLTEEEGAALSRVATGKRVLEIGAYCGRSTICLAQTAEHVTSVDTFDGRGTPKPRNTLDEFNGNVARYGLHNVTPKIGRESLNGERFDVVFIDGAHDAESVRQDIDMALSRLNPGGLLAFHDYRTTPGEHDGRWDPGVTEAVNGFLSNGGRMIERHGTIAVVSPEVFQ